MTADSRERGGFLPWSLAVLIVIAAEVALGWGFYTRSIDIAPIMQPLLLVAVPALFFAIMGLIIRERPR